MKNDQHDKMKELLKENPPTPETLAAMKVLTAATNKMMDNINKSIQAVSPRVDAIRYVIDKLEETARAIEINELEPYLNKELAKPEYGGQSIDDLYNKIEFNEDGAGKEDSLYYCAIAAARSAKQKEDEKLKPFIAKELAKPEYGGQSIDDLFDTAETDEDGNILDTSLYARAMAAARAALNLPQVNNHKLTDYFYPLDKANFNMWNRNGGKRLLKLDFTPESQKKKYKDEPLITPMFFDYDKLKKTFPTVKGELNPYDKRVYFAAGSLWNKGAALITYKDIYHAMGYRGKIGASDQRKIEESLKKMSALPIKINNEREANALGGYPHFEYFGVLLPLEGMKVITKGNITEAAVRLFREPPLLTFARERNNITTIKTELLQSPLSKTDENLRIEDYLLYRIARVKKKRKMETILFSTLYENTNITGKMQKKRAHEKLERYLSYYQETNFIKRYELEKDKINIWV